tara:strand:- start:12 stop:1400 length:1389 start_codon:yes stop_codon:yes gene_type:complete
MSYKLLVINDQNENIFKGVSLVQNQLNFLLDNNYTSFYINLNYSNINFKINTNNIITLNDNNIILNKKVIFNETIETLNINELYIEERINIKKLRGNYYSNENIPFLDGNNKIPKEYFPLDTYSNIIYTSHSNINLDNGNIFIKNGNLLINNNNNNSNTNSILHIKGDYSRTYVDNRSTITLTNNYDIDTIKIFANYPLITIGDINNDNLINLRKKHDLNLYVNSNVWINKCLGIGTEPNANFGLRVNGNIEITGNIIKLTDSCNLSCNFDLKNYVKKKDLEYLVNDYELSYSVENFSNLNNQIKNINESPFTINTYSICLNDKQVNINYFSNSNINSNVELGMNKKNITTYPSLFVGTSKNEIFRGIVCDNDIAAYSDSNIKYDIKPLKNSLQNLLKLEGIKYKRKDLETNLEYIGLIAQNVEKYYPELVSNHNNTKILAYQNIVAIIIEAIKELYELIKT